MRFLSIVKHRITAPAMALLLLLAACGSEAVSTTTDAPEPDASVAPALANGEDAGDDGAMVDEADVAGAKGDSGESTETTVAEAETSNLSPEEAASANIDNLQSSDDARDIEVLSVSDGSISSLRGAVAGDRPVLLWFWAPH